MFTKNPLAPSSTTTTISSEPVPVSDAVQTIPSVTVSPTYAVESQSKLQPPSSLSSTPTEPPSTKNSTCSMPAPEAACAVMWTVPETSALVGAEMLHVTISRSETRMQTDACPTLPPMSVT